MRNVYDSPSIREFISYTAGRTEEKYEGIALGLGLQPQEFTSRVAELLLRNSHGSSENRMPHVPRKGPKMDKALGPMEVVSNARSNKSSKTKKLLKKATKSYWGRMTAKQRKAEMVRRIAKRVKTIEEKKAA